MGTPVELKIPFICNERKVIGATQTVHKVTFT